MFTEVEGTKPRDYSRCPFLLFLAASTLIAMEKKGTLHTRNARSPRLDYPVLMTMTDIIFQHEILLFVQSSSPSVLEFHFHFLL